MARQKKYANVMEVPTGDELRRLQQESSISVLALSRMTHVRASSIYRAFNDVATKDSTRILLYLALTKPELFVVEPVMG